MNSREPWETLTQALARLEQEDPAVGEAARSLEDTIDQLNYRAASGVPRKRFHKSTPDKDLEVEG